VEVSPNVQSGFSCLFGALYENHVTPRPPQTTSRWEHRANEHPGPTHLDPTETTLPSSPFPSVPPPLATEFLEARGLEIETGMCWLQDQFSRWVKVKVAEAFVMAIQTLAIKASCSLNALSGLQ